MHAERHIARAAALVVADVGADDVATGAAELHLAAHREHAAQVGSGSRTCGTPCLDTALDGKELLAILVLHADGERVVAVGLVPADGDAHADAEVEHAEVALAIDGLLEVGPPRALEIEQAVDGLSVVGEGHVFDLRHRTMVPYRSAARRSRASCSTSGRLQ